MRNVICILFAFMVIDQVNAQFGVRASTNIANFNVSEELLEEEELGYRVGFGLGVFYKVNLDENLSFQPEINYVQQGAKNSGEESGFSYKNEFTFNYIQIPILAKYHFGNTDKLSFFVEGGPYVGFGIGKGKVEGCIDGDCSSDESSFGNSDDDEINNPDFGIQMGVGVNLNSNFSIDIRYVHGFQNLLNDDFGDDDFIRNTAFNIGVGYSF